MTKRYLLQVEGAQSVYPLSPDTSLLEQLVSHGFTQRKACRNGVCQICDAYLLEGSVYQRYPKADISAPAQFYLCTSYPRSDLKLRLIRAVLPVAD